MNMIKSTKIFITLLLLAIGPSAQSAILQSEIIMSPLITADGDDLVFGIHGEYEPPADYTITDFTQVINEDKTIDIDLFIDVTGLDSQIEYPLSFDYFFIKKQGQTTINHVEYYNSLLI